MSSPLGSKTAANSILAGQIAVAGGGVVLIATVAGVIQFDLIAFGEISLFQIQKRNSDSRFSASQ